MTKIGLVVISCLCVESCASDLPVVYEFDYQCQSLGVIAISSRTDQRAMRTMQERVVQLGGNTLLLGSEAIYEMRLYYARDTAPPDAIVDLVSIGVQVRPGETGYWGAALKC